jgi:hypothetical protein
MEHPGTSVAVLGAAETVEKGIRLRPFKRNRLNNGSIPCVLAQYRIEAR